MLGVTKELPMDDLCGEAAGSQLGAGRACGILKERDEHVLGAYEGVAEAIGEVIRRLEDVLGIATDVRRRPVGRIRGSHDHDYEVSIS